MKPTFVGKLYKRSGLVNDNSLYLIIGNYNGKEFILNDNLIIERNKTIQNVIDSIENTSKITNYVSNGALLTSAFLLQNLCSNRDYKNDFLFLIMHIYNFNYV